MTDQNQINTVDSMLPIPQLFAFGLQHVLAMYAGAVAVPIIVAQAMNLPVEDLIRLITADLFTCGIATLIQTLGFGNIGGRIPMIQGVTFASVGPMTMIGAQPVSYTHLDVYKRQKLYLGVERHVLWLIVTLIVVVC